MATEEALSRARAAGLDLIEISPNAQPPVCKIGDFGRLKYEQAKKDKDARKKQRHVDLREVKLRPKIEQHDYETKARMAERLLLDGSKIKVTIMFRGREITYQGFGKAFARSHGGGYDASRASRTRTKTRRPKYVYDFSAARDADGAAEVLFDERARTRTTADTNCRR